MLIKDAANYVDLDKLQNGSDIRGVALPGVKGEDANLMKRETAALTRGFFEALKEKAMKPAGELVIAVGCDSRLTGPYLKGVILNTLAENGITAIDCGLASTPAMFMSTKFDEFKCDGAIMVTASHLPYNRNGFKYFDVNGGFNKSDIKNIIEKARKYYAPALEDEDRNEILAASNAFEAKLYNLYNDGKDEFELLDTARELYFSEEYENPSTPAGEFYPNLMDVYASHLRSIIVDGIGTDDVDTNVLSGLSVCVDVGNGAGGFYAGKVLTSLGANVSTSQFLAPDGRFPNHAPNPEDKEAMTSITKAVKAGGADLGIIFDTDVDRSAAVTGSGREVARNGIVALAAILVSEDNPGSTIVTDSITSTQLHDFLEGNLRLKHLRYKRGYKNVINKAIELEEVGTTCPLAIETSGHAALKENFFLDDGAYLATKIIIKAAQLKKEGSNLDELLSDLKEPSEAAEFRMKITCDDFGPYGDKVLEDLHEWVQTSEKKSTSKNDMLFMSLEEPNYEGVRINFFNAPSKTDSIGWALLRKSLHDPVMPMNIESNEKGGIDKIKEALGPFLAKYDQLDTSSL